MIHWENIVIDTLYDGDGKLNIASAWKGGNHRIQQLTSASHGDFCPVEEVWFSISLTDGVPKIDDNSLNTNW